MVYCISDLHGCHDEFMALLEKVEFNPANDTVYVLGDAVDRGEKPLDCIRSIMKTKGVHLIMGNHEQMMLKYYDGNDYRGLWFRNGGKAMKDQFDAIGAAEREKILAYLRSRPGYKTVKVNGRRYFLSHSGLDVSKPFKYQLMEVLVWSRDEFFDLKALDGYICVFGHTPTHYLNGSSECSVWFDGVNKDKVCIDCGCVYGGALAALRLDDGEAFYVNSKSERALRTLTVNQSQRFKDFLQHGRDSMRTL